MWEEVDEDEEEEKEQKRNVIKGSETPTIKKKADFKTRRLKFTKKKRWVEAVTEERKRVKVLKEKMKKRKIRVRYWLRFLF